jgi:hypothetical protein
MKTLAQVIGATLILMFGIVGMYQTILPAIVLDAGSSKALEAVSANSSAPDIHFVKTVMTLDPAHRAEDTRGAERCVFPVSLERVTR